MKEQYIITNFYVKPIPVRFYDWTAVTVDYEPGDPIGYGETQAEAIADLKDKLDDTEDEK